MRKRRTRLEDQPISASILPQIELLSKTLLRQIDQEVFSKKYMPAMTVLKLVGAGLFIGGSVVFPNLPRILKPYIKAQEKEFTAWKRFNIPYLKRTISRLEKQKLVTVKEENGRQVIEITSAGARRILKLSLNQLEIKKPKQWDGRWRLISYDIPGDLKRTREFFRDYLCAWGFYPLHESVFLHAYPCEKEVEFLREYLGIGKFVRIFQVLKIENDKLFREFFGV